MEYSWSVRENNSEVREKGACTCGAGSKFVLNSSYLVGRKKGWMDVGRGVRRVVSVGGGGEGERIIGCLTIYY